jgi:hypothetical protein
VSGGLRVEVLGVLPRRIMLNISQRALSISAE